MVGIGIDGWMKAEVLWLLSERRKALYGIREKGCGMGRMEHGNKQMCQDGQ